MKKFEIGKIYEAENGVDKFKVVDRSEKYISYVKVYHFGNWNEQIGTDATRKKIKIWNDTEIMINYSTMLKAENEIA